HEEVERIKLTPDARFELETSQSTASYWLEMDMGTERAPQLADKCRRYWHTYKLKHSDFPTVLFVAPDAERVRFIQGVVEGGPDEAQDLFQVVELRNLLDIIN
ncbi:MAG: replication-relaxation family protein, partial [Acidobacteria bacterium]|nr:replication-relaxation family protein [Acidobacteriota bacterium]